MEPGKVQAVLASLRPSRYGYQSDPLPKPLFHGAQVTFAIQTESMPVDSPSTPNASMMALARLILSNWETVLEQASREFTSYHEEEAPDATLAVDSPHIWIDKDMLEEENDQRWTFVIGHPDAPDYGTHIEFEGLRILEVWCGD